MGLLIPAGFTGCCPQITRVYEAPLFLALSRGKSRLLWTTGLSMISHCWVTALGWDLPAQDLQALAHPHIPLSSIIPLKGSLGAAFTTMANLEGGRSMAK